LLVFFICLNGLLEIIKACRYKKASTFCGGFLVVAY